MQDMESNPQDILVIAGQHFKLSAGHIQQQMVLQKGQLLLCVKKNADALGVTCHEFGHQLGFYLIYMIQPMLLIRPQSG